MAFDVLGPVEPLGAQAEVFGDSSYGTAEPVEHLRAAGVKANVKVQKPSPPTQGTLPPRGLRHRSPRRHSQLPERFRRNAPAVRGRLEDGRVRSGPRVTHDFSLLAAAVNLARLAILGLTFASDGLPTTSSPHARTRRASDPFLPDSGPLHFLSVSRGQTRSLANRRRS